MTDSKRSSVQGAKPVPVQSGMKRSNTVRNLNSAGNKVKDFFKIKTKKSNEKPMITSPQSYGPGDHTTRFSSEKIPTPSEHQTKMNSQDEKSTQELQELHAHISQRMIAVTSEKQRHQQLTEALAEAQRIYKSREAEYSAIEHTFFEHTRTVRATDDDLSTIREAFKILKYAITRLIMSLNKKADLDRARAKFSARWPHITFEPALVNLLAEKMVHEHLIHSVFAHIYPGLKINAACRTLSHWLQENQSTLCLRQQVAAIIAKSPKDGEIQKEAEIEKEKIKTAIYQDLADVYHPYLNEDKGCHQKLSDIVDRAVKLVVAIRGQDVDISTVSIEEGKQVLDEETMVEAKGRTSGVVQFCICPTFMGGDKEHGFLEKAKVVVS